MLMLIGYFFSVGTIDLALSAYSSLYSSNKINHWSDKVNLIMNLHDYSRGLAYAAVSNALQEVNNYFSNNFF